ncbi:skin secretory protein xP2-like [Schistocerca nitens]|uniref:skin secretory protein xP2-like n=1 Tax=Schistocerca nitens TaxID=7011 RepID=UPI0021189D3E|nr:skin secretory protein xP2-like [Schistocerca nitens]
MPPAPAAATSVVSVGHVLLEYGVVLSTGQPHVAFSRDLDSSCGCCSPMAAMPTFGMSPPPQGPPPPQGGAPAPACPPAPAPAPGGGYQASPAAAAACAAAAAAAAAALNGHGQYGESPPPPATSMSMTVGVGVGVGAHSASKAPPCYDYTGQYPPTYVARNTLPVVCIRQRFHRKRNLAHVSPPPSSQESRRPHLARGVGAHRGPRAGPAGGRGGAVLAAPAVTLVELSATAAPAPAPAAAAAAAHASATGPGTTAQLTARHRQPTGAIGSGRQRQLTADVCSRPSCAPLLVLDATGRRDPRREAASPDAASTAAEWAPDKALRCQTPWGCPRKAAAVQAAQPPLGKAARLRGRRPSAPKAVTTEEGPQAPERPPGALPHEAAREASTGRAVGVVAATAAVAALGAAAKSEGNDFMDAHHAVIDMGGGVMTVQVGDQPINLVFDECILRAESEISCLKFQAQAESQPRQELLVNYVSESCSTYGEQGKDVAFADALRKSIAGVRTTES